MSAKNCVCCALACAFPLLIVGCPTESSPSEAELNKQLVIDSYDKLWNQDDETAFDDLIQIPGYVHHETDQPDVVFTSYEQLDAGFDAAQTTMPDLRYTLDRVVAEDDLVVAQWTATGTFTNAYGAIEPTGEVVSYSGVTIFRLANGKIVESWTEDDDQDILEGLTNQDIDNSGIIAGDH